MQKDTKDKYVYAPSYYTEFKCIADKCKHSCCIDWEICIDDQTYNKYCKNENIINTVSLIEGIPTFSLTKDGRCPHLKKDGLCNIILKHGEDYLSEICKNHPRFYNPVNGRIEAGIGIVCEEACRLILQDEKPFALHKVLEKNFKPEVFDSLSRKNTAFSERDKIIKLIEANNCFEQKLIELMTEYSISDIHTADEWIDIFLELEVLDKNWRQVLNSVKGKSFCQSSENSKQYDHYYERLLKYFVYRHVSISECEINLRARLAFCILSVKMIRLIFETEAKRLPPCQSLETLIDFSRRYSAEIEYSEDNTAELIFEFESVL